MLVALMLSFRFLWVWLLNTSLYPSFDAIFPGARDINQTFTGTAAIVFLLVAMRNPRPVVSSGVIGLSILCEIGGTALAIAGVDVSSAGMITLGSCMRGMSGIALSVCAGLALTRLSEKGCLAALLISCLLKYLWMGVFWFTSAEARLALLMVFNLAEFLIAVILSSPVREKVRSSGAPRDMQVTNPFSFLPLTSRFFVAILLFEVAFGYALTFGSVESYPQPVLFSAIIVVLVALYVVARHSLSGDFFYGLAFVFELAGYLVASYLSATSVPFPAWVPNVLLNSGDDMFTIVVSFMLASIGRKNLAGAVPVLLVNSMAQGYGIGAGALIGIAGNSLFTTSNAAGSAMILLVAFLFAVYNFFFARKLSFDRTVSELQPIGPLATGAAEGVNAAGSSKEAGTGGAGVTGDSDNAGGYSDRIDMVCQELSEGYRLTPREAQVLGFLAHGRNVAYMQETLTLSRNTIKTHVANVYNKLGVHSHQELIDLVESRAKDTGRGAKADLGA